jgi:hypothetical protein
MAAPLSPGATPPAYQAARMASASDGVGGPPSGDRSAPKTSASVPICGMRMRSGAARRSGAATNAGGWPADIGARSAVEPASGASAGASTAPGRETPSAMLLEARASRTPSPDDPGA